MKTDPIHLPVRIAFSLAVPFALAGCVTTGQAPTAGPYRVAAGKPVALEQSYLTLDRRCRPQRGPTAIVTEPPAHGSVRVVTRRSAAVYGPGPYQHCDGRFGPGLAFEYTSRPDYRGPDAFSVRIRYADGELRSDRFGVDVR